MKMKKMDKRIVAVLAAFALLANPLIWAGTVELREFSVVEDSANSTTWTIGGTVAADFDTSITYDPRYWDNVTVQVKFKPLSATSSLDSAAVTVVLQMSNDELFWTPIDSAVAPDSLAFFKNMTKQYYRYARFVTHHGVKADSAGSSGTIKVMARGVK